MDGAGAAWQGEPARRFLLAAPYNPPSLLGERTMDRRAFLAAAATAPLAGAAQPEVFGVIDTHQHLWDLDNFRLPWLKKVPALARSYRPDDYSAATAELGKVARMPAAIAQTVYMEVDVDPAQQVAEAEYVLRLCRRADNPMAAVVLSGRPAADDFAKYLDRFRDSAYVKGIRQVLHVDATPPGYCLEKNFLRGIRLLGERGLSYDLCMRAKELPDAVKLIDACPETRFILDHCGNADVKAKDRTQWQKDIAAVAKRKNIVGKVSGIVASAESGKWTADDLAPIIRHTLEVFGPERVMFGGDWPVCTLAATYRQWFEALASIVADRPEAEQRKLFHDNAALFYGLD
jgi:predicted TIM-barrel fold metal-dependent hydrolase